MFFFIFVLIVCVLRIKSLGICISRESLGFWFNGRGYDPCPSALLLGFLLFTDLVKSTARFTFTWFTNSFDDGLKNTRNNLTFCKSVYNLLSFYWVSFYMGSCDW